VRKTLLSALAVAVLFGISSASSAQDSTAAMKPVLVVSFSGYDALFGDIEFLGKLGGNPDMAKGLEAMLKMMTQGQGLAGLDTTRPWGAVVETNGAEFPVYGFLPVSDLKQLAKALEGVGLQTEEADDGALKLETEGMPAPLFIKQQGDWAFLCPTAEALAKMPKDPSKALAGLTEKYDLAVQVTVQNVPLPLRQMLAAQLQMGAQAALQRQPGETDEAYELRTKLARQGIEQSISTINDLDTFLLGLAIDSKAGDAHLDIEVTAVEGTKLAQDFAAVKSGKTAFAGFVLPEASISVSSVGTLSKSTIEQQMSFIETIRGKAMEDLENQSLGEEEMAAAKKLLGDLLDLAKETIESGKTDTAMSAILKPDSVSLVGGAYLADGEKLEKVIKDVVRLASDEEPQVAEVFKLDSGKIGEVRLHKIAIPVPATPEGDRIAALFGETVEILVGIDKQAAYVALGPDAEAMLKKALEASKAEAGKEILPMKLSVSAGAVAQFIAAIAEDDQVKATAGMVAAMLAQAGSDDHVILTSEPLPNGTRTRLQIEQGILKVLGSAGQMASGGGPGM